MSYRFNDYALDPRTRRLTQRGQEIAVEPRVFDLVVYLVAERRRAVGRDELIAAVWGRVDGSDATLAQAILKARRLFGDDGSAQRTIRTVARFGYQWVAATKEGGDEAEAAFVERGSTAGSIRASTPVSPSFPRKRESTSSLANDSAPSASPEQQRIRPRPIVLAFAVALLS